MKKFLFYAVSLLLVLPAMAQTPADAPGTTTSTPPAEGLVIADGQVARLKKPRRLRTKGSKSIGKWVAFARTVSCRYGRAEGRRMVQVRIIVETADP